MSRKRIIKVNFVDNSSKAFALDLQASAQSLREIIVERIGLKQQARFALYEKRNEWERCVDPEEKPIELQDEWNTEKETACFLFKKKIFLKDEDREMEDPVAKDLVFKQAQHSINNSELHPTTEQAILLAGLQMQAIHGDHQETVHTPGFLTNTTEQKEKDLKNYIPKHLFALKKTTEWEALVLKHHATLKELNQEKAKRRYLDLARSLKFYGTTFFPPCKLIFPSLKMLPNKPIISINYEGVFLFKKKAKEPLVSHTFSQISSWSSTATAFIYEIVTPSNDITKFVFETKNGAIIAGLIQNYVDILLKKLKDDSDNSDDSDMEYF